MEAQRKLALSLSLHSHVIAGHDHSSNERSVFCISRLGATVVSNRSTLQPPNPDRASDRPIGMNPNRAREQPMRTGPVARLSGVQVAEGEVRHGSRQDRRGPHFTRHTIPDPPPPPLKAEWQGGSGIHLSVVDHDELISTVRELRVQFGPPPPPPLKAEWQGGSGMKPQP
jgi:hypothetical protein